MSVPKCEMSSHFELEDTGESFVEKRDYKHKTWIWTFILDLYNPF